MDAASRRDYLSSYVANHPAEFGLLSVPIANIPNGANVGDFILSNGSSSFAKASSQADAGTEALNQEVFHDTFIGVALNFTVGVAGTHGSALLVATKGRIPIACVAGVYSIGGLVGLSENAAGTALEDQIVESVATPNLAVGRVGQALQAGMSVNWLWVDIVSTLLYGGPQVMA